MRLCAEYRADSLQAFANFGACFQPLAADQYGLRIHEPNKGSEPATFYYGTRI